VDHLGRAPGSQQQQRQLLLSGLFVPVGRSSSPVAGLRAQSGDMLEQLEQQLAKDWPKSFMKVLVWTSVTFCNCYCDGCASAVLRLQQQQQQQCCLEVAAAAAAAAAADLDRLVTSSLGCKFTWLSSASKACRAVTSCTSVEVCNLQVFTPVVLWCALQVFLDSEGAVVVSFHRSAAACEGDVGAYMNYQAAHGGIMQEYRCDAANPNCMHV
jgi:hypothetical protein